jgi:hypothetical protein
MRSSDSVSRWSNSTFFRVNSPVNNLFSPRCHGFCHNKRIHFCIIFAYYVLFIPQKSITIGFAHKYFIESRLASSQPISIYLRISSTHTTKKQYIRLTYFLQLRISKKIKNHRIHKYTKSRHTPFLRNAESTNRSQSHALIFLHTPSPTSLMGSCNAAMRMPDPALVTRLYANNLGSPEAHEKILDIVLNEKDNKGRTVLHYIVGGLTDNEGKYYGGGNFMSSSEKRSRARVLKRCSGWCLREQTVMPKTSRGKRHFITWWTGARNPRMMECCSRRGTSS